MLYEILVKSIDFKRKEDELLKIENITIDDVKNQFRKIFYINPHKLSIQIYSSKDLFDLPNETESYYLNKEINSKIGDSLDLLKN